MKAHRVTLEVELQDTVSQMLELIEFKLHQLGQVECWIVSDASRERQVACVDAIVSMSSQPNYNLACLASNSDKTSTPGNDCVDDEDDAPTDPSNRDSVS